MYRTKNFVLNLETAVEGNKVMQGFNSESFAMVGDHSQLVKAPTITSDYGLKDCVNLAPSTAVSRLKAVFFVLMALLPFLTYGTLSAHGDHGGGHGYHGGGYHNDQGWGHGGWHGHWHGDGYWHHHYHDHYFYGGIYPVGYVGVYDDAYIATDPYYLYPYPAPVVEANVQILP